MKKKKFHERRAPMSRYKPIYLSKIYGKNNSGHKGLTQRGFMGTIAYDYSRSIAEHSVNRRKSPAIYRNVLSGYVHLAEHDGWHCRRRFAKVVLSSFARLK